MRRLLLKRFYKLSSEIIFLNLRYPILKILLSSVQKKYYFGIGGEVLMPLLISRDWKERKRWMERGAPTPLLLLMPLPEMELPLLQFAPSQISPWATGTHQNKLYFQSKMCRSWRLNTVFIWVPKLLGLYPSLDFEQKKSILLFPLVSWSFCSIFFGFSSKSLHSDGHSGYHFKVIDTLFIVLNFSVLSLLKHWDQHPFSERCWCCHRILKPP